MKKKRAGGDEEQPQERQPQEQLAGCWTLDYLDTVLGAGIMGGRVGLLDASRNGGSIYGSKYLF